MTIMLWVCSDIFVPFACLSFLCVAPIWNPVRKKEQELEKRKLFDGNKLRTKSLKVKGNVFKLLFVFNIFIFYFFKK